MRPAFNAACEDTLEACLAVSTQRGDEYADSWALENQATRFLDLVLREIGGDRSAEAKRLLMVASLCDVKISRTLGPYKSDTFDDLINYLAALRSWLQEYTTSRRRSLLKGCAAPADCLPFGGNQPKICKMA